MKKITTVLLTIIISTCFIFGCANSDIKGKYQSTKEAYSSILRIKSGDKFEVIRIIKGLTEEEARENATQGSGDIISGTFTRKDSEITFKFTYWYLDQEREDSVTGTFNSEKKQITLKFFGGVQTYKKI